MDAELMKMLGSNVKGFEGMVGSNPEAKKQMEGFWKFLDNMAESNPDEYNNYIKGQMTDMKQEMGKEEEQKAKQNTV